ncbi:MAG: hypothetical protein ACTSYA_02145 [Candidatus Kariarchaeaceae archaeon]
MSEDISSLTNKEFAFNEKLNPEKTAFLIYSSLFVVSWVFMFLELISIISFDIFTFLVLKFSHISLFIISFFYFFHRKSINLNLKLDSFELETYILFMKKRIKVYYNAFKEIDLIIISGNKELKIVYYSGERNETLRIKLWRITEDETIQDEIYNQIKKINQYYLKNDLLRT